MVVDDNKWIGEAVERTVRRCSDLAWCGWTATGRDLPAAARAAGARVVLLDLDVPGEDSFETLATLAAECPDVRAVILSGYLRGEFIDRALQAGAWGYVSKNDDLTEILEAVRTVADGRVALGPSVSAEFQRK
jgi:two-component system invasion response regulator UvrY